MTNFGVILSKKREELGLTIKDISLKLKIRERYLSNIEGWDFTTMPHKVYIRGYIRLYSDLLGLDPNQGADEFNLEIVNQNSKHKMPKVLHECTIPQSSTVILFLFLIIIVNYWSNNEGASKVFDKYGIPTDKVNMLSSLRVNK